ncbi:MAG TPA: class I SAM-dependent methyltransferase [Elusimicrobiales bacterium]|nr:class I SAM-dependent methyltransferase [Elusimicrobiales bacterium]
MPGDVCGKYEKIAGWFDANRGRQLMEREYLEAMTARLPEGGSVLDLGCGSGEPLAGYFIRKGFKVTGVDGSPAMIALCRERFPSMEWLVGDMRGLALGRRFDAVLAWDSSFHLSMDEQRAMFPVFGAHLKPGGCLLFTSGPSAGDITGAIQGEEFPYSSLDAAEYRRLLAEQGLNVVLHRVEDPACGGHTVWLAVGKTGPA